MQEFLKRKADSVALAAGAVLGIIVIAAYAYGIGSVAANLDDALNPDKGVVAAPTYDIGAASRLDYKGLAPGR